MPVHRSFATLGALLLSTCAVAACGGSDDKSVSREGTDRSDERPSKRKMTAVLNKISRTVGLVAVATLLVVGCGDDDEPTASNETSAAADGTAGSAAAASGDEDSGGAGSSQVSGAGGGSGSIVLDGETIQLDSVRCHLKPQPAAAGGGNILFVVQGEGENSEGNAMTIDISRYDDGSTFAGDVVDIYVGDVMSDDVVSLSTMAPTGSVELDGSTASADGLTLEDSEAGTSKTAAFTIDC